MATTVAELTTALGNTSVSPRYPFIDELNTWVWLSDALSQRDKTL